MPKLALIRVHPRQVSSQHHSAIQQHEWAETYTEPLTLPFSLSGYMTLPFSLSGYMLGVPFPLHLPLPTALNRLPCLLMLSQLWVTTRGSMGQTSP